MNKYFKVESRVWLIMLPLLIIGSIYGLFAQEFIDSSSWKHLIYANKFSSIQPKHMSLWSIVILVNVLIMLYWTDRNTKYRVVYKLYITLMTAAFGMWFIFDAFTRTFATLPDVATQLTSGSVGIVIFMALFEIIVGYIMIRIALYLGWKITSKYIVKRSVKIDKIFKLTSILAISIYSLVFISQLLIFISYQQAGIGGIIERRWPNIGPDSQGLIALAGVGLALVRIKSINKNQNITQWKFMITTTFIFALITGLMFHDNCIFIYDYVSDSGSYNVGQVWGLNGFVDFSTWLLIVTIPLLMVLIIMYLVKLTALVIYISNIELTKKEKKKLKKAD